MPANIHTCATCGTQCARKFCGRACFYASLRGQVHTSVTDRFWAKVQKTDTCWLWTGSISNGYGCIRPADTAHHNQPIKAHRLSWEIHYGTIPPGVHVCHHCDVRSCVRPDHLFLGTDADNSNDKVAKGRQWHPTKKLTPEDVRTIRRRVAAGEQQSVMVKEFGVSSPSISHIVTRKSWKHID